MLTPDMPGARDIFDRLPGNQGHRNRKTGEIWRQDRARNTGSGPHGPSEWKVGNKPGQVPTRSNKTTVAGD